MPIRDEDRAEAERLKLLPQAQQRQIVAMYRDVANGKGVRASERTAGLKRAAALERLLKLTPRKRKPD
jgi:hypothetical protein